MAQAQANGEGFVAGEDDVIGLFLDPRDNDPSGHEQPFIIGVPFDELTQDCVCPPDAII